MHTATTNVLSKQTFSAQVEGPDGLPEGSITELLRLALDKPVVLETELVFDSHRLQSLVFALPHVSPERLKSLGHAMPRVYNEESADLRTRTTYLSWSDGVEEVRVDTWLLHSLAMSAVPGFLVVFLSSELAVITLNRFDEEGLLDFMTDLQCHSSSSGPNYHPWVIYSDEEMVAAKGSVAISTPDVATHHAVHLAIHGE